MRVCSEGSAGAVLDRVDMSDRRSFSSFLGRGQSIAPCREAIRQHVVRDLQGWVFSEVSATRERPSTGCARARRRPPAARRRTVDGRDADGPEHHANQRARALSRRSRPLPDRLPRSTDSADALLRQRLPALATRLAHSGAPGGESLLNGHTGLDLAL
ncbi:hypothetical protein ACTIVE_1742 [Actinomadura verrucosospora]|uniref:Uncharacterized protein n=1 Tax=Actinomadura verrucosospora TaxID=46165 RepID=A0A7D3ZVN8_ACTVE|nr:hypothetical protein ACTIVE_1742 [Actinomadura verrucosospora]